MESENMTCAEYLEAERKTDLQKEESEKRDMIEKSAGKEDG